LPIVGIAQQTSDSVLVAQLSKEWIVVYQSKEVKVSVLKTDCIDPVNGIDMRKLLYRVENLTNNFIAIQWDQALNYSNKYIESSDKRPEYRKRFALKPLEKIEGNCEKTNMDQTIFVQMTSPLNDQVLISFRLINIQVFQ
jgi:hypothetical protein